VRVKRIACVWCFAGAVAFTAGCAPQGDDLDAWMAEQERHLVGSVDPLPEMSVFPIVAYQAEGELDPFRSARIEPDSAGSGAGAPDMTRPREPLEQYPLESLDMVGVLMQGERIHALIKVDGALHQVRVGNYMGQNHGLVTRITETQVTLNEIVEDAGGEWVERTSRLLLQEQQ